MDAVNEGPDWQDLPKSIVVVPPHADWQSHTVEGGTSEPHGSADIMQPALHWQDMPSDVLAVRFCSHTAPAGPVRASGNCSAAAQSLMPDDLPCSASHRSCTSEQLDHRNA